MNIFPGESLMEPGLGPGVPLVSNKTNSLELEVFLIPFLTVFGGKHC